VVNNVERQQHRLHDDSRNKTRTPHAARKAGEKPRNREHELGNDQPQRRAGNGTPRSARNMGTEPKIEARQKIQTSKAELDLDVRKAKASNELSKLLAAEEKLNQEKLKTEKERITLEKQLTDLEIKKKQLKNAGISVSKAELDLIQKEETIKRNKLKQLQDEEVKIKQLQDVSKQNISVWKEQIQLENALISTKKKKQLATEGTNRALSQERIELALVNKQVKQETLERLGLVGAYTKLSQARNDAKIKLRDLIASEQASTAEIKKAQIEFDKYDAKVKKADKAVGDFSKNVGNYKSAFSGLKDIFSAFGIVGGVAAFASIAKNAINIIKEFDQSIADLKAITGAAGKDLQYLKNQAIELGKGTKGGASAVVEAYKLIASAKPELLENVQSLNQVTEAVLTLSKASGLEMPEAATALTDAMNQFGVDASQATKFVDTLAAGAKYGAAEIPQVTEALLKFGAVARTSNISIQESTALVELLAENGLKGADAGTALRNVLLKLSAPDALPLKAKEAIERLGISFKDLSDTSKPIQERLEILKPLLKDNAGMVKVFGLENVVAATNVLQHTDRLADLTKKMDENGIALEQANTRTDTLTGAMDKLESSWSSFILSLSDKGNAGGNFLKFWVNDAIATLELLDGWFTSSEVKRERQLAQIRKEANDNAIKNYSDKNKRSLEELQNVIAWNNATITENTRAAKELEKLNIKISKDTSIGGSQRYETILANRKKIAKLNNETVAADAENKAVKGFIQQRSATPKNIPGNVDESKAGIESEKERTAREKAAKEKLDAAKRLSDSLYELQKQRLERRIKLNDDVAKDEAELDSVRITAVENSQKEQERLLILNKNHLLEIEKLSYQKELEENKGSKANIALVEKNYVNNKLKINEDFSNKLIDLNQKTKEDIDKINQFDFASYQASLDEGVKKNEIAMNSELAAENERFKALQDLGFKNEKEKEDATRSHEQRLFDIKKEFAIATANLQVANLEAELSAFKAQSDGSKESNKIILETEKKLSEARLKLTELGLDNFKGAETEKVLTAKEQAEKILQISQELTSALSDLGNAFSQAKIQKIDDEISKNNEFYDKQIALAENDARKKDFLEKERARKNDILEKKKREAQRKQAIFEKAVAIAQIAIQTALAIVKAAPNPFAVAAAAVLGAIQLATAIATPIPKYKHGRKGGPAELAIVGDGGVSEIITSGDGSNPRLTPNVPTLTKLGKDDIVHKSMSDYENYVKQSIILNFKNENQKIKELNSGFENNFSKELLEEMKRNTRAIEKGKPIILKNKAIDIPHSIWAFKNINWRS